MDLLVFPGSGALAVKAETADSITLRGPLVLFSDESAPDLAGDFFTKDTDFGLLSVKGLTIPIVVPGYYQHGQDSTMKGRVVGAVTLTKDDAAVWAEYQINLRDDYERRIADLAKKGKLGQSSGAVSHLVEREAKSGGVSWIKSWPIGEASLTPTPCEPRTYAEAKALPLGGTPVKADSLSARVERVSSAVALLERHDHVAERHTWAYAVDVFEDAVVANVYGEGSDRYYRIPYTDDGRTATLAPSSDWTEVERVVTYDGVTAALKSINDECATLVAFRSLS